MQIPDLTSNPRIMIERIRSSALESLRPGQVIEARVLSASDQSGVKLQIGDSVVLARTQLNLSVGEKVMLSVAKAPHPLELRLLRETSAAEVHARVFRTALPIQAPVSRLLNQLRTLTSAAPRPADGIEQKQPPASSSTPPLVDPRKQAGLRVGNAIQTDPLLVRRQPTPPVSATAIEALGNHRPVTSTESTRQPQNLADEDLLPALQRILSHRLSSNESMNPARLRQALEQSGLLLEARLAAGQEPINDLKGSLLHLLFRLRARLGGRAGSGREITPRPDAGQQLEATRQLTELLSQTEASLARILVNQLRSTASDEGQKQVWHFELPIHQTEDSDDFQLRIGRESGDRNGKKETIWSVRLDFDLAPLGPVSSQLTLSGDEISSHFTAARRDSAKRLEQAMPKLNEALVQAGLKVGRLTACEGKIHNEKSSLGFLGPLLDERA